MSEPVLKRNRHTGYICLLVPSPGGRLKWISTGEIAMQAAKERVAESGADKIVALAKADALTADSISAVTTGRKFSAKDVLAEWKAETAMNSSDPTAHRYHGIMEQFFREYQIGRVTVPGIHRRSLNQFINDPKCAASTRHVRLAALRSYYEYASGTGRVLFNPVDGLKVQHRLLTVEQREKKSALPFAEEEYQAILAATTGFWHWATVLAWHLGYRIVDIAKLERASLRPDSILIYPQKNGRRLEIPLSHPFIVSDKLLATLDEIRLQCSDPVYCFPEQRAMRVDETRRHGLTMQFLRILTRLDIRHKSFHGLRHSFKLRMDAAGLTIEEISKLMGHASVKTTEGYGRAEG